MQLVRPILLTTAITLTACSSPHHQSPPPQELDSPAPITGGTLAVVGRAAVAADPDLDRVYVVDLDARVLRHDLPLEAGDEPGRVIAGPAGTAYVALRRGGAILRLDVATGTSRRIDSCPAPRGLAYDGSLHVACSGGELLTYADEALSARVLLDPDLRDVVVTPEGLLVTRFRSAEVLHVVDGEVARRVAPPTMEIPLAQGEFSASVAWRAVQTAEGALVVHQRSPTLTTYYGRVSVASSVSAFGSSGALESAFWAPVVEGVSLPVDIAVDAGLVAVVGAGSREVGVWTLDALQRPGLPVGSRTPIPETPVAAAFDHGTLWVQTRDPATLQRLDFDGVGARISLPGPARFHAGHAIFHQAQHGLACASCHPEGHDDGRVWRFSSDGRRTRRTQTLAGGVGAVAPFHWQGEHPDLTSLVESVFTQRMGGPTLLPAHIERLAHWLETVPPLPAATIDDEAAVERGRALFHDEEVACATCHAGPRTTTGEHADVGRGTFAIPTLQGIALRGPYMHDGCAHTLEMRFTDASCGGGDAHGVTSHLDDAAITDLVAYLRSL